MALAPAAVAGTLNFQNVTSSRVVSTVAEIANNEKAVDAGDFDNADGRPDVIVMFEHTTNSRPTILRKISFGGTTAFVDWTPASAFPGGNAHKGWKAIVLDSNGDGDQDIFLGGLSGDHLFENVPPIHRLHPFVAPSLRRSVASSLRRFVAPSLRRSVLMATK